MNVEKQDREDLLQDIFIKALRSLKQLKDVEKMDAWLWSITRNEVNRHWRQVMKNRESLRFLDAEEIEINVARRDGSYYLRLADELEQIGDREQLARLLRKLPEDAIILLRLYYYEGYNLSEIAQITEKVRIPLKAGTGERWKSCGISPRRKRLLRIGSRENVKVSGGLPSAYKYFEFPQIAIR